MANPEHLKMLKEGIEVWNKWRKENPEIIPDLRNAHLSGANLIGAHLSGVNLSGSYLSGAYLSRADLSGADIRWTNLRWAYLRWAYLSGADFSGSNLSWADFDGTNLEGTSFTGCVMGDTTFADVDLSQVKGLDTVQHLSPSSIGIDTIYRSQGKIPEIFLRGAGVSDELIAFIRAMGGTIQFYSCFISYSGKDQLFAERLYEALQAKGVRCWFSPHDVQSGKKLLEQIDVAIRMHERLLLILSPESIHSEWVKTEIIKACTRERVEKRRVLFPVRLKISYEQLRQWECFDAATDKDLAQEIREYYIPDFTEWESAAKFKEEFEKLVRDLKKADEASKGAEA